jgi:hypothetical protein
VFSLLVLFGWVSLPAVNMTSFRNNPEAKDFKITSKIRGFLFAFILSQSLLVIWYVSALGYVLLGKVAGDQWGEYLSPESLELP